MENDLIDKYKNEMLNMYKRAKKEANIKQEVLPVVNETDIHDSSGGLLVQVTTVNGIYPVKNAKVTVFSGDISNMQIIDTDFTNESGRSKVFVLSAPKKELSLESQNTEKPYASYNMMVSSEGYLDNIHLNIPIFSGITSIQGSNLMLKETAGVNIQNNIYDESQKYNL